MNLRTSPYSATVREESPKGYIVLSVNCRGETGYVLDYREADNLGPSGPRELDDLLGAITYLRGRQDVDRHRIGIWGSSNGSVSNTTSS